MRLIFPVAALVGVLVLTGCTHTSSHHGKGPSAANTYSLSFDQVREAAQDGDADAQYALGYMYYYGQNVTRNGNQARFWIGRAASQHHKQAIRALKMMDSDTPVAAQRQSGSSELAQTSGVRRSGQGWQEVRRSQEKLSQSEPVKNVVFTKSQNTASANAANADNDTDFQNRKHPRAELHKKSSQKQWANKGAGSKNNTTSNEENSDLSSADQSDGFVAKGQQISAQRPNFQSAQEKNTRPAQKQIRSAKNNSAQKAAQTSTQQSKLGASAKGQKQLSADERSIFATPNNHYTLQLMGAGSKGTIQQLISRNHFGQKAKVYQTKKAGKDFYVLIYGSYPSKAAANAEIARLPASVKQLKPWAKPYSAVKASIHSSASTQSNSRKG